MKCVYDFKLPPEKLLPRGGLDSGWVWVALVDAQYHLGTVHLWIGKPGTGKWNPHFLICPANRSYTHSFLGSPSLYGLEDKAAAGEIMAKIREDIAENWWLFLCQVTR